MSLPDVTLNIRDGALGTVPPNTNNIAVKAGPCVTGALNTLIAVADLPTLQAACGKTCKTVEAAAVSLAIAGGPLYMVPVNPSTYGAASSVTKVGTGAETLTVAAKPPAVVILKAITVGSATTSQWQLSLDGGTTWSAAFTAAATLMLPGYSFLTVAFGAGTSAVGDTFTFGTDGTVTAGGGNTGTLSPTVSSASIVDDYSVVVTITTGGALGTAQFTYSLDGGNTTSPVQLVPSSGKFVIPDTGILLTFSGTSTAGDYFTFTTTAPSYTTTDLTNAFNAVIALPQTWFLLHAVGQAASAAAAATLASTVDSLMATAATGFRFARAIVEAPWDATNTDSVLSAAFASTSAPRTDVGAGTYTQASPLKGHQLNRNAAWQAAARLAKVAPSTDAARVADGSLPGVLALQRDDRALGGVLDAARFVTLRTIIGRQGFYISNARSMAPTGSDYTYNVNGRVMDIFCAALRNAALNFLNDNVRVDSSTGYILEQDAQTIENYIAGQCRAAVTQPGYASSLTITVQRNVNILSTGQLPITGRVVPLGYARSISVDIGFTNPALQQKSF